MKREGYIPGVYFLNRGRSGLTDERDERKDTESRKQKQCREKKEAYQGKNLTYVVKIYEKANYPESLSYIVLVQPHT